MPVPNRRVDVSGGHVGQPDERIGEDRPLAGREPARRVVGIGGLVPGRDHDVVDRPDGLEPGSFGSPGEPDRLDRIDEGSDVGKGDSEF